MKYLLYTFAVCLFLIPSVVLAEADTTCTGQGGSCKSVCSSSEETKAASDCGTVHPLCCIPLSSGSSGSSDSSKDAGESVSLENPLTVDANPSTIIGLIIKAILGVVGGLALVMTVYGGFQWLTAAGNKEKIDSGSKTMLWAIVGLVITLSSYLLVDTFMNFLKGNR